MCAVFLTNWLACCGWLLHTILFCLEKGIYIPGILSICPKYNHKIPQVPKDNDCFVNALVCILKGQPTSHLLAKLRLLEKLFVIYTRFLVSRSCHVTHQRQNDRIEETVTATSYSMHKGSWQSMDMIEKTRKQEICSQRATLCHLTNNLYCAPCLSRETGALIVIHIPFYPVDFCLVSAFLRSFTFLTGLDCLVPACACV